MGGQQGIGGRQGTKLETVAFLNSLDLPGVDMPTLHAGLGLNSAPVLEGDNDWLNNLELPGVDMHTVRAGLVAGGQGGPPRSPDELPRAAENADFMGGGGMGGQQGTGDHQLLDGMGLFHFLNYFRIFSLRRTTHVLT